MSAGVEAIRARAEAATPGPWQQWGGAERNFIITAEGADGRPVIATADGHHNPNAAVDLIFAAHACEDIPALIEALDEALAHADGLAESVRELTDYMCSECRHVNQAEYTTALTRLAAHEAAKQARSET